VRTCSVVGKWRCCCNPEDGSSVPTKRWCLSVKRGVTLPVVCSDRLRVNPITLFSFTVTVIQWPNDVFMRLGARLSPRFCELDPMLFYVGFIVGRLAMGQIFLPVLRLSHVSIIPPMLHTHSFITDDM